ncbi:DUF6233 domain-containing protein [Streptomyces sp. NPDC057623]|uniref:DUF6233 domain-containing protein n=1 Tax=Streptomyces sp. NPDC057623 TaxID=3346187 RepID=UPI0036B67375
MILAYLDKQVADNETVGIYLRLQRDAVQRALATAKRPIPAHRERLGRPIARPGVYLREPKVSRDNPNPPLVHTSDCKMVTRNPGEVDAHRARLALTQEFVGAEPCPICRPDTALGLLE